MLKTGESQVSAVLGSDLFGYLAKTPAEAESFAQAMTASTAAVTREVVRVLDLSDFSSVVDVGGASGALLFAVLQANPNLCGIVFDRPDVVSRAQKAAEEAGLADRVGTVGGDFFASIPQGDLYLIKYILHDWDDAACVTILRNCRKAMNPGGRVAVIELMLGEIGEPGLAPLMDVNMMVLVNGRERTFSEYRRLFEAAGFSAVKISPTNTPMAILEAAVA